MKVSENKKENNFRPTAENKALKRPVDDWPGKLVYITPSTHRLLNKKRGIVDGEEHLSSENDTHVVFIRKTFVDSSGTTWANETIRLSGM